MSAAFNERRAFWLQQKGWPAIDYPGTLFLGRAINKVGEARHGSEWTGHEPVAFVPPPIPPFRGSLVVGQRPTNPRSIVSIHHVPSPPPPPPPLPDPEKYHQLVEWNQRNIDSAKKAVERWADVHRTLWTWLIEGRIGFAVRWSTGDMAPGAAIAWNADKAADYLTDCRLPLSNGWSTALLPVFVSADDLATCLKPSALSGNATVAAETAAVAAFTALFRANKNERTMTNAVLMSWVQGETGRHLTKGQFERAKATAARDADAPIWRTGGAPRGARTLRGKSPQNLPG